MTTLGGANARDVHDKRLFQMKVRDRARKSGAPELRAIQYTAENLVKRPMKAMRMAVTAPILKKQLRVSSPVRAKLARNLKRHHYLRHIKKKM